jgi:hypothetical protein
MLKVHSRRYGQTQFGEYLLLGIKNLLHYFLSKNVKIKTYNLFVLYGSETLYRMLRGEKKEWGVWELGA